MQLTGLPEISAPLSWQGRIWSRLLQQVEEGRLPHALLLGGEQHTGKAQLALALARYLLCSNASAGTNCGGCAACERSAAGVHGDFRWVQPEGDSRVIKVDQVRDLVEFLNQTAGFGQRKVAVLAPADAMNVNAFNALLKSLEEPSSNTFLVLVSDRLYQVPATIRSRCQLWRLPSPTQDESLAWLDHLTGDREASQDLLQLADGRPMLAQRLYLDGAADEARARRAVLPALISGQVNAIMAAAAWESASAGEFLEQLAGELERLVARLERQHLQSAGGRAVFELLDDLAGLRRAVAGGSNPNRELLLEAFLSKVQTRLGPLLSR